MAPPFNINNTSPAPNQLINAFPADEQANRTLIEEWLSWISDPTTGNIRASVLPPSADPIPSGTKMLFVQTAAPTGYTKDVTHNNKALRIVNGTAGTGGTTAFTSVFASRTPAGTIGNTTDTGSISSVSVTGTVDNATATGTIGNTTDTGTVGGTALTEANLPAHNHGASGLTFTGNAMAAHAHGPAIGSGYAMADAGAPTDWFSGSGASINGQQTTNTGSASAGTPSGSIGGNTANTGSGTTHAHSLTMNAHNHSFTGSAHNHTFTSNTHNHTLTMNAHAHTFTGTAMDFAVQYVDVIIATKD